MKKIIKILEKPLIIVPVFLIISLIAGYFVYENIGLPPKIAINNGDNLTSLSSIDQNLTEGKEIDLAFLKNGKVNKIYIKTGDTVKKGQLLANLDFTDVKGALLIAKANYEKVINGATGPDIDVAKAGVATAQTALNQAEIQQDLAVKNAYKNLLNTGLVAVPQTISSVETPPTISGMYSKNEEGQIVISISQGGSTGAYFNASGIITAIGIVSNTTPQPIGDSGLFIQFPNTKSETNWIINIPNEQSSQYTSLFNTYQTALATRDQVIANAKALLDQANSTLVQKEAMARPEDIAVATGAVQVAQSAYDNDFIYAPADGLITAVNINEGEVALMNQKAIGMIIKTLP